MIGNIVNMSNGNSGGSLEFDTTNISTTESYEYEPLRSVWTTTGINIGDIIYASYTIINWYYVYANSLSGAQILYRYTREGDSCYAYFNYFLKAESDTIIFKCSPNGNASGATRASHVVRLII